MMLKLPAFVFAFSQPPTPQGVAAIDIYTRRSRCERGAGGAADLWRVVRRWVWIPASPVRVQFAMFVIPVEAPTSMITRNILAARRRWRARGGAKRRR